MIEYESVTILGQSIETELEKGELLEQTLMKDKLSEEALMKDELLEQTLMKDELLEQATGELGDGGLGEKNKDKVNESELQCEVSVKMSNKQAGLGVRGELRGRGTSCVADEERSGYVGAIKDLNKDELIQDELSEGELMSTMRLGQEVTGHGVQWRSA